MNTASNKKTYPKKASASAIDAVDFSNLQFGRVFTDHMVVAFYKEGKWSTPKLRPYGPLPFSPAMSVFHYGQAIFEGMKAFYAEEGQSILFRPDAHYKRINRSLSRMAMPELPEKLFMESIRMLLKKDKAWLKRAGQLYVRPFAIAIDEGLKVKISDTYMYAVLACPVGSYFTKPLDLKIETEYTRSAPGGVGFAKAAGNYAASMLPTREAQEEGFDQLIWTDAKTHTIIEESGMMNIACVIRRKLVTPPAGNTILAGITRDSLLTIAPTLGIKVEERKITVNELIKGIVSGAVTEVFGMGTAATIASCASITHKGKKYLLKDWGENSVANRLFIELDSIKRGNKKAPKGWICEIK